VLAAASQGNEYEMSVKFYQTTWHYNPEDRQGVDLLLIAFIIHSTPSSEDLEMT
jgi:hypothetical protein